MTLSDGINNFEFSDYTNGADLSFTLDSTTTYSLIQLVASDSCAIIDIVNPITITVNTTTAPIVTPISYCAGSEAAPLIAEGTDLKWYTTAIGGTSLDSIIPSTDSAGMQQFWVSQTVNGCESDRAVLEVNIEERPTVPIVSTTNICVGEATRLVAEGMNLLWYEEAIGGEGFTFIIPSTDSAGMQQFWVSQTINGCESDRVLMDVIVKDQPLPPITTDMRTCEGTSILLTAAGENLQWYTSETGGIAADSIISDPNNVGTQTYWVSQIVDGCESIRSSIDVRVDAQPTPPITTNFNTCAGTSILLTAEGENLLWYNSATEGSGVDSINSDPNVLGVQTYWVSQTIAGCESARAMMIVSNNPNPPAPGVLDAVYFLNEIATPIMAFGSQLLWYATETSNDGFSTPPIPNTSVLGVQTYWVSQTISDCESDRVPVTITVRERVAIGIGLGTIDLPTPNANGSIQLIGLLANTTYTLIYDINGSTITTTITTDAAGNYVIADLVAGSYSDIRVVLDGQSSSSLDVMLAPVICNLRVTFSENDTICLGEASSISIVIENGSNPHNLSLTDGFSVFEFPSYISGTIIPVMPTTTSIYSLISLEDNNGCTLIGDDIMGQVTINVQETPAPLTTDITYCEGAEAMPLSAEGNNLLWYASASGGVGSSTAPIPNTDTLGRTTYWVSQELNNCESTRAMISVFIEEAVAPPVVTSLISYCLGAEAMSLSAEGNNLLWYTSASGGVGSSTAPIPNTDAAGVTTYWVSQQINNCESTRTMIEVTVDDERPSPPIVESVNYCRGATTLPLNVQGENLRWYVLPTGGNGTSIAPQPTADLAGRYFHWVSQTINGCESELARIAITISETPEPEIGLIIPPSPCLKNGAIQLKNLLPNQNYLLSYAVNNDPVAPSIIKTTNSGSHIFSGLYAGSYTDIKVQFGNCQSVGLELALEDNTLPFSATFTGTPTICNGEIGTLRLDIDGGIPPYDLLISDINRTYSLSEYISGEPITVRPTETTSYFLVSVEDSNGCMAILNNEVVSISVSDCTSSGALQNEPTNNGTNLFSIETQDFKKSESFELFQNNPNPFSSQTTIGFYLPGNSNVELILRDNTGKMIKRLKEYGTVGVNHITVDDLSDTNGLIYYQLITDFGTQSKKMLLVR